MRDYVGFFQAEIYGFRIMVISPVISKKLQVSLM